MNYLLVSITHFIVIHNRVLNNLRKTRKKPSFWAQRRRILSIERFITLKRLRLSREVLIEKLLDKLLKLLQLNDPIHVLNWFIDDRDKLNYKSHGFTWNWNKNIFYIWKKVIMDGNKGNKKRLQPTRAFKAAFLIRPDKKNTRKNLLSRCFHFIKRSESVKLEFISWKFW